MASAIAHLPMYVAPAPVAEAQRQWLASTAQLLGLRVQLAWDGPLPALWRHPHLWLAQTCGYPLVTALAGQVGLVGRPVYRCSGASAGLHRSFWVSRKAHAGRGLAAFAGSRLALNSEDSNTGMNLLRQAVAPLSQGGRFFSAVQLTGGHQASLASVAAGTADLAAIDCVTYAYLSRFQPAAVEGLQVVGQSAPSPTLPYISAQRDPGALQALRGALNQALQALPEVQNVLGLAAVLPTTLGDYQVLLGYQAEAEALGYPRLA